MPTVTIGSVGALQVFCLIRLFWVLKKPMVRMTGWFDPVVGEVYEMLYQNDAPYLFDSSKFAEAFVFQATPYAESIRTTAETYRAASSQGAPE